MNLHLYILGLVLIVPVVRASENDSLIPDSMITALQKIPRESRDFSEARRRLAEHFLAVGTVSSREKAQSYAHDAVDTNPRSLQARLTLVRVLHERGAYLAMAVACDDILTGFDWEGPVAQVYSEAYYYKGLVAERSALKYKDMIEFVESSFSNDHYVSLMAFGYDDLAEAANHFENALRHDPTHRDALLHLALVYMEVDDYDAMLKLTRYRLERNPFDKDACLYAAYACYHLGDAGQAAEWYHRAFLQMTTDERAVYESSDTLLAGPDPMFLTKENEKQLEQFNRVTYANLRFRRHRSATPGAHTERGRLYVRYGRPDFVYSLRPDLGMLGGAQVWRYDKFVLNFRDDYASGHFLLDDLSVLEAENLLHTQPYRFLWPKDLSFNVRTKLYQFRHPSGWTKIVAYLSTKPATEDSVPASAMQGGFFLTDSAEYPLRESRQNFHGREVFSMTVHTPADSSVRSYSIELKADSSQKRGVVRGPILVRDFSSPSLQLSDVLIGQLSSDQHVTPMFTDTVRLSATIYLYFETYNLTLDNGGQSRYRVDAAVSRQHAGLWRTLFGSKDEYRVTSSTVGSGTSVHEASTLGLDFSRLEPGDYHVNLKVTDLNNLSEVTFTAGLVLTR